MQDISENEETKDLLSLKRDAFWLLWKKRGLLLIALLLLIIPLYGTFSPLFEFILFAVSLAALTYPVFFRPIEYLGKKILPNLNVRRRSELCAVLATLSLLLVILSPFLLIIWEASNPRQGMIDTIISIALGEEEGRDALLSSISGRIQEIQAIYPRLPIDEEKTVQFVSNMVGDTREFSGTFLEFLFKGTQGFVAELALALIALSFLYAHGGGFLKGAMRIGGFEQAEVHSWLNLHRKITLRLLNDTVLTSLVRGVALALVAHLIGGFFFLPVFFLGAFIGLVPVVGSAMVWLPLSSLVWTKGEPVTALVMASLCLLSNYAISQIRIRMGRRLHDQGAWLSFMLFLGIIGGILSYGPQGFIIGPMAVILAYGLVRFLANQSNSKEKI
ncbi:MAG: AI-2E family transporter [Opitutae bacterium]|jgi:predicted PurR-regulated permease PerM|nr:AI-2E family transporter [Opitutae bacterium]MBT5717253.1 AI-2E family transporter [Opitutae bacterium]